MRNETVADLFEAIAKLLEINGEVVYKVLSYRRAAESIRALGRDLAEVRKGDGLKSIPAVGTTIAAKIEELLDTGSMDFYDRLTEEIPADLLEVLAVRNVGAKKTARFWKELEITNLEELEQAARDGRVRAMSGMGRRMETLLLENISEYRRLATGRILLDVADRTAGEMLALVNSIAGVERAAIAGSLRRRRETIGDLDVVAAANKPVQVLETFVQSPLVLKVLSAGGSKASVILADGVRAQLWVYPPEEFGSVLQYATGSQAHNVRLRELAQKQGVSLSEHGFKHADGKVHLCAEEEDVYRTLGLDWIPPELREDRGEFTSEIPTLLCREDLQSDLHTHSTWSDGRDTLEVMTAAALAAGLRIFAVTDHSRSLGVAGGLSVEEWEEQHEVVERLRIELAGTLLLLHGAEVEILTDGGLDFPDEILKKMDIVIASLHGGLQQEGGAVTERLLKAMENPFVDIIAHPTGRLLGKRAGMDLDMEVVFQTAANQRIALEINAHPQRLDLSDIYARRAIERGCLITLNSDSHNTDQFSHLSYGVSVARRGWAAPDSVVNTWGKTKLQRWLGRNRR